MLSFPSCHTSQVPGPEQGSKAVRQPGVCPEEPESPSEEHKGARGCREKEARALRDQTSGGPACGPAALQQVTGEGHGSRDIYLLSVPRRPGPHTGRWARWSLPTPPCLHFLAPSCLLCPRDRVWGLVS